VDAKKACSRGGNYQDSMVAPLGREHDDEAVQQEDEDGEDGDDDVTDTSSPPATILSAIGKVTHHAFTPLLVIVLFDFIFSCER